MYHDCRLSRCWKSPASLRQRYFPNPHLQLLAAVAETAQVTLLWRHQVTSRLHQLLVLELIVSFSCDLSVQCTCTDYWLWTIRRASVNSMYLRQSCFDGWLNKKLSCRTETARRVVSLNISLSHSRSCEVTQLRRSCMSPYKYFNDATSVYRTVSEIFSVKVWPWNWGKGRSRLLKMAPFDRSYDFLLVRHCNYSCMLYHFQVIWRWIIMTLKR